MVSMTASELIRQPMIAAGRNSFEDHCSRSQTSTEVHRCTQFHLCCPSPSTNVRQHLYFRLECPPVSVFGCQRLSGLGVKVPRKMAPLQSCEPSNFHQHP